MLGIVIATFNRLENLKLTLLALENQTESAFYLVVADDGSTDGTKEYLQSLKFTSFWKERLDWVNCGVNIGFRAGRARNMGVANLKESCSLICFVDSDVILHHKALKFYHLAHLQYPDAVIMGKIYWLPPFPHPTLAHHIKERQTNQLVNIIPQGPPQRLQGTFVGGELRDQIESGLFSDDLQVVPLRPELAITACIGYPTKLFKQIGGFDENMIGYGYEDIDLGLMAQKAEATSLRYSKLQAFHVWHPKTNCDEAMRHNQSNLRYVLNKHGPNPILENELKKSS